MVAIAATGTLLQIGDGAGSESFTTIAEVKDIDGPKMSTDTVDTTSHDGPGFHTFLPTLKSSGDMTFDINFNKSATQGFGTGLYNDYRNRTRRNFQLVPPSISATASFAAYVTGWEMKFAVADVQAVSVTLTIDGDVTWA
jgi:Lambda phage tail tube protein, TTP